jgi:hypothetical protein
MTKPSELRRKINALLDEHGPLIQAAFMASIADIKSQITLKLLVQRLERGDIAGALDALNLERSAFSRVENAIAQAYNAGGSAMTGNMPTLRDQSGARIVVRFDARNQHAEEWLRTHSSQLVSRIIEDQRTAIQGMLHAGLSQGQNLTKTALDIVGRVNRASGRRDGGLIGLTGQQSDFVASARSELSSGDPAMLRNYLGRTRRDKRFDRAVMKAINGGKLDTSTIDQIIGRYSDRLLQLRGEMLARTETLTAVHAAKHEGFRQGLDKTNYPPEAVTRVWRSAGDSKVRHTHAGMNGQVVQGLETPFVSPSGAMLRYPGDTGMGAGADEVIGCRCDDDYRIDFSFGVT